VDVLITNSKNGSVTCSLGNISLHSTFNPEKEAERFVNLIETSFLPSFVVITGPCLSYTAHYLKERFPCIKTIAIQYSADFNDYSQNWDYSFTFTNKNDIIFINDRIFSIIGEEKLFSTLFLSWKPSEKAWPDLSACLWKSFKDLLSKAESVISTRNFFNRRWFFNSIRFFSSVKKIIIPKRTDKPIVIAASGPSLKHAIPFLKEYRNSFILLAASSSIQPLLSNGIIPDFCISTDGGWYAKKHLEPLFRNVENISTSSLDIPLIIPPEAAVPSKLLENANIIPLSYSDFPDKLLFEATGFPFLRGERNGTVSGTAAVLALNMTTNRVFFCGLDLAVSKEFQHTQPNALEIINSNGDCRTRPQETRCAASSTSGNVSLSIYRNWFSSRTEDFYNRVFRIVTKKDNLDQIQNLHDIYIDSEIPNCFSSSLSNKPQAQKCKTDVFETRSNKKKIIDYLENVITEIETNTENSYNMDWYKIAALKEIVLSERSGSKSVPAEIKEKTFHLLDAAIKLANRIIK
jgi:hypothetical protein